MDSMKQLQLVISRLPNHTKEFELTWSEGAVIGEGMLHDTIHHSSFLAQENTLKIRNITCDS